MIGVEPPRHTYEILRAVARHGALGAAAARAAIKEGDRVGLADELGRLSFAEIDLRANALANSWREAGLRAGDGVAILCRNHRGFLDATLACGKLGGRALYLNTDFAGPQVREVCEREGTDALVYDEEFAAIVDGVDAPRGSYLAWVEQGTGHSTLEELIAAGSSSPPPKPAEVSKVVMLTSGTTGTPKGAPRENPRSLGAVGALLSKVPFQSGEATCVAAPMFHALGFAHTLLAMGLGSTVVTRRRFDAEATLGMIESERCSAVVVVPVMLTRMLALGHEAISGRDLSSLRIIFCGGAQLEADLAIRAQDAFGDVLYNLYGSTEVAYATIATPEDLRVAPGCAGKPPLGTTVRLYDEAGNPVTGPDRTGRIFVGNGFEFGGYTGGGTKEVIDGLMSSGDVGHFDSDGRLFIDGRDDEMIVSGGENVFPREIEELLATHEAVFEAALIGVDDENFGKRLRAFVVTNEGRELSEAEVKDFVKANLARFKVPRDVIFLEELPRNPSGKVLKRELAEAE
jgi:fatty-acyl-CoA synthase